LSVGKAGRYAGGNPACARPTPEWQKGISTFMKKVADGDTEVDGENRPVTEEADYTPVAETGAR